MKKVKFFAEHIVSNHENTLLTVMLVVVFGCALWVLVNAIVWPGPIYLTTVPAGTCPAQSLAPPIPDAAFITILVILFVLLFAVALLFCSASGAWMNNPKRNRIFAAATICLIILSFIQLIAPACYR
jgi:hypothetical protein